ncbi:hypothetical protein NDU88_008500 [Pleurodeles waltl]|uniref:Uncharacterized protein n=1 Tax=Pleurodeles waltl TaxID=8319 RepID=A0AAV7PTA8_PLEWA|nr:hypothetical protein NDU88_008500 [Pleurodeles waltl]
MSTTIAPPLVSVPGPRSSSRVRTSPEQPRQGVDAAAVQRCGRVVVWPSRTELLWCSGSAWQGWRGGGVNFLPGLPQIFLGWSQLLLAPALGPGGALRGSVLPGQPFHNGRFLDWGRMREFGACACANIDLLRTAWTGAKQEMVV